MSGLSGANEGRMHRLTLMTQRSGGDMPGQHMAFMQEVMLTKAIAGASLRLANGKAAFLEDYLPPD